MDQPLNQAKPQSTRHHQQQQQQQENPKMRTQKTCVCVCDAGARMRIASQYENEHWLPQRASQLAYMLLSLFDLIFFIKISKKKQKKKKIYFRKLIRFVFKAEL